MEYRDQGERERLTCVNCPFIFYENPAVGVAVILFDERARILLGLRNRGDKKGKWCIPCGYVDYDEDIRDAAVREFKEETNLDVSIKKLYAAHSNFHNPDKHSVGIWFLAEPQGGELHARDDLDEAAFYALDDLPPMAFETDLKVIEKLMEDKRQGTLGSL